MNKKLLNHKKILLKIALLLGVIIIATLVMSSCTGTVIDVETSAAEWADKEVALEAEKNFLDHFLSWIGTFISWVTAIMPANSYVLALFVFAILMEVIMIPFSIKQQKNSIRQAKLKPKEMAIRRRYAGRDDRATQQKVSAEIQELYQKENFNPLAGCMPLLVQMPIIIVLYWVVVDPLQYVMGVSTEFTSVVYSYITTDVAGGGLGMELAATNGSIEIINQINELGLSAFEGIKTFCANGTEVYSQVSAVIENAPNFNIGPLNLGYVPSFTPADPKLYWLLVIPVLTFLVYFFSMKLNRKLSFQPTQNVNDKATACSNNMMDFTMPLMSVFMVFVVPAAVGVYWMFKSVVSTGKQFIMSKAMPLPRFTEDDYKAAEKEMNGKLPKKIQKSANAGKVRSLHHIDDEDYEPKQNDNSKSKKVEAIEEPAVEEKTAPAQENEQAAKLNEGVSLKDDNTKRKKDKNKNKENK